MLLFVSTLVLGSTCPHSSLTELSLALHTLAWGQHHGMALLLLSARAAAGMQRCVSTRGSVLQSGAPLGTAAPQRGFWDGRASCANGWAACWWQRRWSVLREAAVWGSFASCCWAGLLGWYPLKRKNKKKKGRNNNDKRRGLGNSVWNLDALTCCCSSDIQPGTPPPPPHPPSSSALCMMCTWFRNP